MTDAPAQQGGQPSKAKVFISYSRKDIAFADRLDAALKARGFEPLIDRTDIYAFEEWWKRVEDLIVRADTIIFVLSPDAVKPDTVALKEVAFAASLNKRFAPIVFRPVQDKDVPEALARLNFIFFDDPAQFEKSADKLAEALNTDIGWIRRHTELGELARRWTSAKRPSGLLLRSPLLEEAERWIAARPSGAPAPTDETQGFIRQSRQAATRRRNILTGSLATGLLLALGLAALAFWQRGVAIEQRDKALLTQSRFLADLASQRTGNGDMGTAVSLALEALPGTRNGGERPYAPAAELALSTAWQHLQEVAVLGGHQSWVRSASFSPDGRRAVTASGDTTARIWDVQSRRTIAVLDHPRNFVFAASFSPDGSRVITGAGNIAQIWDASTGALLQTLSDTGSGLVETAAFSPKGDQVITASRDHTARIWTSTRDWNAAPGRVLILRGHADIVNNAAFSRDGGQIVSASRDNTARIWEAQTGKQLAVLQHANSVLSAAFSADGRRLITTSSDHTARIWDLESGKTLLVLQGHTDGVQGGAFSPDGRHVATASHDKTARIWDSETGRVIAVLSHDGGQMNSVAFSPDGSHLITASSDGTAHIWNVHAPETVTLLGGHNGDVREAIFSPDGRFVVSICNDRVARVWDITTGRLLNTFNVEPSFRPSISSDKLRILMGVGNETARIWDVEMGQEIAQVHVGPPRDALSGYVDASSLSPDGNRVAVAFGNSLKPAVQVVDVATGKEMLILTGHSNKVTDIRFSPDGRRVVTASYDNARIWDALTGKQLLALDGHTSSVKTAAFSPDGRRVITASNDNTARIWDAETGRTIAVLPHSAVVMSAAFSRDGKRVVTSSAIPDKAAQVWDAESGEPIMALYGHSDIVHGASFSPDGRRLGTASSDKTARIWEIFPTTQSLIESGKQAAPRCLTREQRKKAFLDPEPPAWCIELAKWPYDTQDWKDWLSFQRADANPPLPDAPDWQAWLAARKPGQAGGKAETH
jgi:WD40 repeat protein